MKSLEELKRKTISVDKDIAILNSELKKLVGRLKKEFDINIRDIDKHLAKIEGDDRRIIKKINHLYSKAEATLKGIKK